MNFQIRIRIPDAFGDIEFIKHWLDETSKGFAFEHDLSGNHHYHIYLFGLDRKPDPMRKHLGRYMSKKENYAVGVTAGKKKEPVIDWVAYQYGTTDKLIKPVWTKGFSDEQLNRFHDGAERFYAQQKAKHDRRNQVITEILVIEKEKEKPDRVWQHLMEDLIRNPDMYDGKQIHQIKSMISVSYLRRLKAVPRPSDLHRYALSLYYIVKHELHVKEADIPLDALDNEYLR